MICLSKEGCLRNNVSIEEVLLLFTIYNKVDIEVVKQSLIDKGYITAERSALFQQSGWRLTNKGIFLLDSVCIDSEKETTPEERLNNLAIKLKEIFPKGKKEGTSYYWTEGVALIVRRLKLFFKKYGNTYTDQQILNAAEKYVQGFNGNYTYMRLLKYFILKEKVGAAGEVEGDSELVSYIENAGQEDTLSSDWTSNLI